MVHGQINADFGNINASVTISDVYLSHDSLAGCL
jgi:hypothetical protein